MARRFFINDFEQSLKEHADEFKMIPSKKVWHGIYNDMHPGRRWPSVAMSLLLLFTLILVGHLNTHNAFYSAGKNIKSAHDKNLSKNKNQITQRISENNNKANIKNIDKKNTSVNFNDASSLVLANNKNLLFPLAFRPGLQNSNNTIFNETFSDKPDEVSKPDLQSASKNNLSVSNPNESANENFDHQNIFNSAGNNDLSKNNITQNNQEQGTEDNQNKTTEKFLLKNTDNIELLNYKSESQKIDFIKTKNLSGLNNIDTKTPELKPLTSGSKRIKFHKKRNENISWSYFANPVVSSVRFIGKEIKAVSVTSLSPSLSVNSKPNKVLHNAAFGFEAGAQMNIKLSSKLKFATGVQLTYSGYKITSNEVHPAFATLILKNSKTGADYSNSYITHYGDGTGHAIVSLRNYSWQLSIPIGLQYQVYGNNKIQLNAAANIEPSVVLKSNAYILSSNGNNYVNDPSLLRNWNASSNFGAFVSFKSNKFKWQIGPNLRYQWLSTYQKNYTIKEHLVDYGIRIAISK